MKETELLTVVVDSTSTRKAMGNIENRLFMTYKILGAKLNYNQFNYYNKESYSKTIKK